MRARRTGGSAAIAFRSSSDHDASSVPSSRPVATSGARSSTDAPWTKSDTVYATTRHTTAHGSSSSHAAHEHEREEHEPSAPIPATITRTDVACATACASTPANASTDRSASVTRARAWRSA